MNRYQRKDFKSFGTGEIDMKKDAIIDDTGLDPKQFKKVYDLCINNTEHFNERVIQLRRYKDLEEQLLNKYNELQSKFSGDGIETYTTGYRAGHKNGQIELLEWILNIDTGCRQEAEKALNINNNQEG